MKFLKNIPKFRLSNFLVILGISLPSCHTSLWMHYVQLVLLISTFTSINSSDCGELTITISSPFTILNVLLTTITNRLIIQLYDYHSYDFSSFEAVSLSLKEPDSLNSIFFFKKIQCESVFNHKTDTTKTHICVLCGHGWVWVSEWKMTEIICDCCHLLFDPVNWVELFDSDCCFVV